MSKKYVFITAYNDHVSFRGDNGMGSDPVISPETSDAVLAKTMVKFQNLGYEIEIRDERNGPSQEAISRLNNCVARFVDPTEKRLEYVLCVWKRDKGFPVEWVVWTYNNQDNGFYHGHYYRDLASAVERFFLYKNAATLRQLVDSH